MFLIIIIIFILEAFNQTFGGKTEHLMSFLVYL